MMIWGLMSDAYQREQAQAGWASPLEASLLRRRSAGKRSSSMGNKVLRRPRKLQERMLRDAGLTVKGFEAGACAAYERVAEMCVLTEPLKCLPAGPQPPSCPPHASVNTPERASVVTLVTCSLLLLSRECPSWHRIFGEPSVIATACSLKYSCGRGLWRIRTTDDASVRSLRMVMLSSQRQQ
jgi:hypothetical protein